MEKRIRNLRLVGRDEVPLGELIHRAVRKAIETAVDEELQAALGAGPYERRPERSGYRNGAKSRTLTGPTGPVELTLPRARVVTLIFIIIFVTVIELPALLVLGGWFLLQLASAASQPLDTGGGVAYFAHIGGFIFGLLTIRLFANRARMDYENLNRLPVY